jgi:hypothetical protein
MSSWGGAVKFNRPKRASGSEQSTFKTARTSRSERSTVLQRWPAPSYPGLLTSIKREQKRIATFVLG